MRCTARIKKGLIMNIGLDYDDTYTRHPAMWDNVIKVMRQSGHRVYVVTWRFPNELDSVHRALAGKVDGIFPTSRKAKEKFMYGQKMRIDVWIDDNPSSILHTMQGFEE